MDNEQLNNPADEMAEQGKQIGNSVKQKVGQAVKQKVKQAGKKALAKVGKVAVKLLAKLIAVLAPYLTVILIVLSVLFIAYYVLFEIRGSEQVFIYDKEAQNETIKDAEGGYNRIDPDNISPETEAIQQFYKYMSEHSYWQIIGDDNEKLEQDTGVYDYYNKEKQYYLNSSLLFALDETLYKKEFIYPEQFVKHVNYNPEDLTLKPLTDDEGYVNVESKTYDEKGNLTDEMSKTVADYGLGSIYKYKKDERKLTVEGVMYKKEVWDSSLNDKVTVDTNEEFVYTMDGYPQEIDLMTKAITFVGEFEFEYEKSKSKYGNLTDNSEAGKANEAVKKVLIGHGRKYKWVTYTKTITDKDGNEKTVTRTKRVFDRLVPLYGYRRGAIYETLPALTKTIPNDKGQKYLRDYLYNFKANVPFSVMTEFNFQERVGSGYGMGSIGMATGSAKDSIKLQLSMQHFGIAQIYGNRFKIDPYLIVAVMAQESGGNADVNKAGLMQIIGNTTRTMTAKNASGVSETFNITPQGRQNAEDSIRWGTMYLKNLLDTFDGDPLKATLGYNMGAGTVLWIKENYPDDWDTDAWVTHIPEANQAVLSGRGDNAYLEHVFQYYAGTNGTDKEDDDSLADDIVDGIKSVVKKIFSPLKKDYSEETNFMEVKNFLSGTEVDWGLRLAGAFDKVQLFSKTDTKEDLTFWDEGYSSQIANAGNPFIDWNPEQIKEYAPPLNIKNPIVTSRYGPRWNRQHAGTDIAVPVGTPLYASADGTVAVAVSDQTYSKRSWGNYVKLAHNNNNYTLYGHMSTLVVNAGDTVKQGQLIGYSGNTGGSTGPHLHFEFYLGGSATNKRVDSYPIAVQPDLFP